MLYNMLTTILPVSCEDVNIRASKIPFNSNHDALIPLEMGFGIGVAAACTEVGPLVL